MNFNKLYGILSDKENHCRLHIHILLRFARIYIIKCRNYQRRASLKLVINSSL